VLGIESSSSRSAHEVETRRLRHCTKVDAAELRGTGLQFEDDCRMIPIRCRSLKLDLSSALLNYFFRLRIGLNFAARFSNFLLMDFERCYVIVMDKKKGKNEEKMMIVCKKMAAYSKLAMMNF
jgi:hypothetical protein